METHSSSVSSQEFEKCNKEIASCLEMMRESAKVKDEHLQFQFKNLEAQFTEVKERQERQSSQYHFQLSGLQQDQEARLVKMDERHEHLALPKSKP